MNMKKGFTLIELLVVVMVILMLSGLLFRVASLVGDKTMRAKAVTEIQNLQNALVEYMAEYGTYPPVDSVGYEFENTKYQSDVTRNSQANPQETTLNADQLGYRYGLVAHLYERERDQATQFTPYNKDTERDLAAKKRWAHYLKDIKLASDLSGHFDDKLNQHYTNATLTIQDPWGSEYQYKSPPPYLSYRLWSLGPDKADGTPDDISNASF